jgi:hypothetical protein
MVIVVVTVQENIFKLKIIFFPSQIDTMKVIPPIEESYKGSKFVPPPIPFSRPIVPELKKPECLVMTLRSDPVIADSQSYDLTLKYF